MTDIQELKQLAEAYEVGNTHFIDDPEFWEKVTPSTILSLIERIEALEKALSDISNLCDAAIVVNRTDQIQEIADQAIAQQDKGKETV